MLRVEPVLALGVADDPAAGNACPHGAFSFASMVL